MQRREIEGFDLSSVPRAPIHSVDLGVDIVELIYHGSRRATPFIANAVALRFADLINYRKREPRFSSRAELCRVFQIDPASQIVLTGVDHDKRIEHWWKLGSDRLPIIKGLASLGIRIVSTPNFSVLLDNPRTDDLYAIKRIAVTFAEFQQGGIACALHTNGRTTKDFERWGRFVAERNEINVLAYEFITGPSHKLFKQTHLEKLALVANLAGRKLDIIVRGDPDVIPFLRHHFCNVIYIDTTAFMKAHKRQRATRIGNHSIEWNSAPTVKSEPIDTLFQRDIAEQIAYLHATYYGDDNSRAKAA